MTDPFERLTVDLEAALSELTDSTRARLDDIGPRRDGPRPAVARAVVDAARTSGDPGSPAPRALSAASLPTSPRSGRVPGRGSGQTQDPDGPAAPSGEPAPTAVPSRSATPHSPSSVGFYSTVRLRPRVASRPARVGLPATPPVEESGAVPVRPTPVDDVQVVAEEPLVESPVLEEVLVAEPVAEVEAEPVAEVEPEPVAEVEPEPVAEAEVEPEPVVEVEPEPVAVPAPEPVVEDPRPERVPAAPPTTVPAYAVAPRLLGRDRPLRPAPSSVRPGRRRALVAAGGVVAAALVLVVGFLASGPLRDDATRRAVAPAALPAAPGVAPSPGRLTDVEVRPNGSVDVTEWLNLERPVRSVRILPAAGRSARVAGAVVDGAGRARIDLGATPAPQVVTFEEGVDRVLVRYTVDDAVSLSAQDRDRALLDLPLLAMSAPRGALSGPRVVRVRGGLVLGAACGPSKATAEPCGVQRDRGWRTGRAAAQRSSVMLAAVDLG